MIEIVVASNNKHKINEIRNILKDDKYLIYSLTDLNIDSNPEETGLTFKENALIKARELKKYTNKIIIADDSGLLVEKLNNEPGVYSKRYAGENATDDDNNNLLISNIKLLNKNERNAKFVTIIALIINDKEYIIEGECKGNIIEKPIGENGFGYDPIFYINKYKKTFAQLSINEKNSISHRANAIIKLKNLLDKVIN